MTAIDIHAFKALPNKGRTIIFETVYGSKLYGCDMPSSDHDIRGVYLPGVYDFLREAAPKPAALIPVGDLGETEDIMYFPVGGFVDQIMRMKSNCVEIFFAALQRQANGERLHPAMEFILSQKDRMITATYSGFVGHARQRAARYIPAEDTLDITLQANKHVLATLEEAARNSLEAPAMRVVDVDGLADALAEHSAVCRSQSKAGDPTIDINGRHMAENTRVAEAIEMTKQRLERYYRKSTDVEPEVMFKDLCTSLRMMETAADLMITGTIAFPRPTAEYYRAIRRGEISKDKILKDIDAAQEAAVQAVDSGASPLRPTYPNGEHAPVRDDIIAHLRYIALKELDLN